MQVICNVCLQSDILCKGCGNRLKAREITGTEISAARAVHKLGIGAKFSHVIDTEKDIFVIASAADVPKFIGTSGKNVKKLSSALGKNVRVVEKSEERTMIEKILGVHVIGVNVAYPGEIRKIRIHKKRINAEEASRLLEKIFNRRYEVVME
ncbi:MAG: transcription elongation factor NusA [Candidatus Aenigmarchaeota archaeon]|nr:transcription elongation factor NusA [Candidatus Aenigmarchaeota archaeon]